MSPDKGIMLRYVIEKRGDRVNLRDRTIRFLTESKGATIVPSRTTKYVVYHVAAIPGQHRYEYYYFLGKNGAVRANMHNTVTDSTTVTEPVHRMMMLWEKKQGYLH